MLVSTTLLISRVKENTPVIPLDNPVDTTIVLPKKIGGFKGPYGSVSVIATVYNQNGSLVFDLGKMKISNGTQWDVYFTKEVQPVNFIDPGPLQFAKGNPLYNIQGNLYFPKYQYPLIYCKKYNHHFGSAKLQ